MRTFKGVRDVDVSGVSGTGVVFEGVEFSDGMAVIHWLTEPYRTTTVHPDGVGSVNFIHGHGGSTRLVFDSPDGQAVAFPNLPVPAVKMTEISRDGGGGVECLVEPNPAYEKDDRDV